MDATQDVAHRRRRRRPRGSCAARPRKTGGTSTHRQRPSAAIAVASVDHFDVIVSDVYLPGMTGFQLVDRLSALQPHAGVIFISGYPTGCMREANGQVALQKPLSDEGAHRPCGSPGAPAPGRRGFPAPGRLRRARVTNVLGDDSLTAPSDCLSLRRRRLSAAQVEKCRRQKLQLDCRRLTGCRAHVRVFNQGQHALELGRRSGVVFPVKRAAGRTVDVSRNPRQYSAANVAERRTNPR